MSEISVEIFLIVIVEDEQNESGKILLDAGLKGKGSLKVPSVYLTKENGLLKSLAGIVDKFLTCNISWLTIDHLITMESRTLEGCVKLDIVYRTKIPNSISNLRGGLVSMEVLPSVQDKLDDESNSVLRSGLWL